MKKIEFPECWEEVSPAEWRELLRLCFRSLVDSTDGVPDTDAVSLAWCDYVLRHRGLPCPHRKRDAYLLLVRSLAATLDEWMWQGDMIAYRCTKNLLPRHHRLVGPADHGADLTFGEYRHALAAWHRLGQTREPVHLAALCGTLYRPAARGGTHRLRRTSDDVREPFYAARMGVYMDRAARLLPDYLQAGIALWFGALERALVEDTFVVDGHEVSFTPLFCRTGGTSADGADNATDGGGNQELGMSSVLFSVARSGVFGDADTVDGTRLFTVLLKLLDDKQQAERLKRWHTDDTD